MVFFLILTHIGGAHVQHSYPVLAARRGGAGRRLPPTPCKPSTLQLKPTNINFPKLNASPTHVIMKFLLKFFNFILRVQFLLIFQFDFVYRSKPKHKTLFFSIYFF